jgi:hypothetical protein
MLAHVIAGDVRQGRDEMLVGGILRNSLLD